LYTFALQNAKPQALKRQKIYTCTHKTVYEQEDITVLWNQSVHADRSNSKQARYKN
jgi:hypothetical protein